MKRNKYCKCGSKFCESCSGKKLLTKGYRAEMKKRALNNNSKTGILSLDNTSKLLKT